MQRNSNIQLRIRRGNCDTLLGEIVLDVHVEYPRNQFRWNHKGV